MNLFRWLKNGGAASPAIQAQDDPGAPVRRRFRFSGFVQGVGFRWEAKRLAGQWELTGWARNESDGTVTVEIEGGANNIGEFVRAMQGVPRFDITGIEVEDLPCSRGETDFKIVY